MDGSVLKQYRGVAQKEACRVHNPKAAGSNPAPAILATFRGFLQAGSLSGEQRLFCSFPVRTKLKVVHFGSIAQQVEPLAVNQVVAGSNPVASALRNVVQFGRTLGLGPRSRKFESCHSDSASVAQLAEQLICNQQAVGSNPTRSFCSLERYRSGHNEAVLKTVCPFGAHGFESHSLRLTRLMNGSVLK